MGVPSSTLRGFAAAFLLLLISAAAAYRYHARPSPAPGTAPLIVELAADRCSLTRAKRGGRNRWILENRRVRLEVDEASGRITRLTCKENNLDLVNDRGRSGKDRPGLEPPEWMKGHAPPSYRVTAREGKGERAFLRLENRSKGIQQVIQVALNRGSAGADVSYLCAPTTEEAPVEGRFLFLLQGGAGRRAKDDVLLVPAVEGYRKLQGLGAYRYAPQAFRAHRGFCFLVDGDTKTGLLLEVKGSLDRLPADLATKWEPTHYAFGVTREHLRLEKGQRYGVTFRLTPVTAAYLDGLPSRPAVDALRTLYRNLNLLLALPSGPGRIWVAPFGLLSARLNPPAVKKPASTLLRVEAALNEATGTSTQFRLIASVHRHGTETPQIEVERSIRLGGFFHERKGSLSIPLSTETLEPGRYDVRCRIRAGGRTFQDHLNLGVAADEIPLPPPDLHTTRPVERVIARRMSQRVFKDRPVDPRKLSYILSYCAGLIPDGEGRVRDTLIHGKGRNVTFRPGHYEVFVHFLHQGVLYRYDRARHRLVYHQAMKLHFVSELEAGDIQANARVRTVQAPVTLFFADGGGGSPAFFQSVYLAAAALDLGFCTFGDEKHPSLQWPEGYKETFYGRLGEPYTPFAFEPAEDELGRENMPLVDAVWPPPVKAAAAKEPVPREPDLPGRTPNLPAVTESTLTLEEAFRKARQVTRFEKGGVLTTREKAQLLWAAYGRSYLRELQAWRDFFDDRRVLFVPAGVHRTVPSACGEYAIDVYLADETGIYRYLGKQHYLARLRAGDFRREILDRCGAPFEDPAALVLFARRDLLKTLTSGDGYEEAYFAAENMSLAGAPLGIAVGFARIDDGVPEDREARAQAWSRLLAGPAPEGYALVGGPKNRASFVLPGAVAALGRPAGPDARTWSPDRDPAALAPPPPAAKERRSPEVSGKGLPMDLLQALFPEAQRFVPAAKDALYVKALRTAREVPEGPARTEPVGFAADTRWIVPGIQGYNGPIELLLALNTFGRIRGIRILHHEETRECMARILDAGYLDGFVGLAPGERPEVDTVTGATLTCTALARTITEAQQRLCGATPAVEEVPSPARKRRLDLLLRAAILVTLFAAAFSLIAGQSAGRRLVLLASALFLGVLFDLSFSWGNILAPWEAFGVLSTLYLVLVLLSTLLRGRVYCGWICPFGAVQELLYEGRAAAGKVRGKTGGAGPRGPGSSPASVAAVFKFAVLFLLLAAVWALGAAGRLNPEPFSAVFRLDLASWRFYVGAAFLPAALLFSRPFCRWLCPTGALLACLNRLKGRIEPRPEFEACRGCGRCVRACPVGAVRVDPESRRVLGRDRFECIACEECARATKTGECRKG